ncbi:MAG: PhoH family protein [Pseudomonadota bacterium]
MSKESLVRDRFSATGDSVERISFDDNAYVQALAGEHDSHLALLEDILSVRIDPRGNEFSVIGDGVARAKTISALTTLYDKVSSGLTIDVNDVRAAAKMASAIKNKGPSPAGSIKTPKRVVTARTKAQTHYLAALRQHELVFGVGPAGTGKTYLAVAHAVSLLLNGTVEKLILSRPAIEAGERIGFLPGDMKDKVDPYLRPLYDALNDMLSPEYLERRLSNGDIEIAPLAFMRGRTLARSAVILDEAQNATVGQTKMFLTRLGEGAHMVLTGDPSQTDLPPSETSGLEDALRLLGDVEGIGVARFSSEDVVRHPLVGRILDRYDARDKDKREALKKS